MDLLRTILLYLTMLFVSSVQTAPEPSSLPALNAPSPTPYVKATSTSTPRPTPSPTPVPTINITPNPDYKTIRVGDNGDAVRELQQKLMDYGYYTGNVDGRFGNQTRRAVERFQYQHGLGVDGIAGKRTLTVLYESEEVRPAPTAVAPTPSPTVQTDVLTLARTVAGTADTPTPPVTSTLTPASTAAPASAAQTDGAAADGAPVQTEAPKPGAAESPTVAPTTTPVPEFMPLTGYTIWLSDGTEPILARASDANTAEPDLLTPYAYGQSVYVPIFRILEAAGNNVISSDTVELDEYAFAFGDVIYRLTHTEDQAGNPINLAIYKDGALLTLPMTDIRRAEQMIYLPAESARLLGMQFALDETNKRVIVTMPVLETDG